jgi:CheY-like chemotaxis protein
MLIEDMLRDLGCSDVVQAVDTAGALRAIADGPDFDGAILDLQLDGVSSAPVAAALAARGVPFLFATGYAGEALPAPYRDRPHLQKPFRPHELASALARALRGRQADG